MPGSTILLEAVEFTESTEVIFKCGLKARSPWAGVYKISQNLSGNLHSLGVPRSPSTLDGREGQYQYADASSTPPVEPENPPRAHFHLTSTPTLSHNLDHEPPP